MTLIFLTPTGALLALGVVVPLLALFLIRKRARRLRNALGIPEPSLRRLLVALAALVAAGALVGLAAAQPVIEKTNTLEVRTDAEAFFVIDVSRSMLAQRDPTSPQRFERAKLAASTVRSSLSGVPVGIASMTNRVLPHLFPSVNEDVFEVTLERSLGIEKPPPTSSLVTLATSLSALGSIRSLRYFTPTTTKRLVVVLTDGESTPVANTRVGSLFRQSPPTETIFVQFWDEAERVFSRGAPEPQYRPDRSARSDLDRLAVSTRGSVYSEGELGAATQKARELLATGPTVARGVNAHRIALAPYLAIVAFLPLTILLGRRDR